MIEIENNRLYINGLFTAYAAHQIPDPIDGHCYISFSHRHGRNLLSCAGKAWLGDNDGSLPHCDVIIGRVVGPDGLLPDPSIMELIIGHIESREDQGVNTRIKVS